HWNDLKTAASLLNESLLAYWKLDSTPLVGMVLIAMGYLANRRGQRERAAMLLGAGVGMREAKGSEILGPDARTAFDESTANIRIALGKETFAAAWAVGRAMTPEQAICLALEVDEIPATGWQDS